MQVIRQDLHATRLQESAARVWCGCAVAGVAGGGRRGSGSSILLDSLIPAVTPESPITSTLFDR